MQSEATFGDNNQGVQIGYNIDLKGRVFGKVSAPSYDSLPYRQESMTSARLSPTGLVLLTSARSSEMSMPTSYQAPENGS